MANQPQNGGRNVALPDENRPSWRPQDDSTDEQRRRHGDDRLRELRGRRRRDDAVTPGSFEDRHREDRGEDRYRDHRDVGGGRGSYWADRSDTHAWPDRSHWQDPGDRGADRHAAPGGSYRGRDFEPERRGLTGVGSDEDRTGYASSARGDERLGYAAGSYSRQGSARGVRADTGETHVHRGVGPHRGKGPAGYQRSDERIRELVCEALTDDDLIDASRIEVSVQGGEVTLTGTVEDRHAKRDAEDCACSVAGVRDVQNLLRVMPG